MSKWHLDQLSEKEKFHKDNEIKRTAEDEFIIKSINRSHRKMNSLNIS